MKKVAIAPKPEHPAPNPDEWVSGEQNTENQEKKSEKKPEKSTRLTIDVPASLHRRIKSQCALDGVKMANALRELLEKHFSAKA